MGVCYTLGLDPVVYYRETNPENNAVRDAAANVIHEEREQANQRAQTRR